MLKKIIPFFILLLVFNSAFYAQKITIYQHHHYNGKIAGKYPISMDIIVHGKIIKGSYFYDKVGKVISLEGTIDKNNHVEMDEYSNFHPYSGYFEGKITGNLFKGIWTDVTGQKKLAFLLTENYEHSVQMKFYHYSDETKMFPNNNDIIYTQTGTFLLPVSFPQKADKTLLIKNIQKLFFTKTCSDFQKCILDYIKKDQKDYLSMKDSDSKSVILDAPDAYSWENSDSVDILMNDNNILSFEQNYYQYTGGAHGLYGTVYDNYYISSGKKITLWDVFNKQHKPDLLSLIKQKIISEGYKDEVFSMEEVVITDNIAINKKGINFLYNIYDISPYSAGIIELFFTYKEIKDLLNQNFRKENDSWLKL